MQIRFFGTLLFPWIVSSTSSHYKVDLKKCKPTAMEETHDQEKSSHSVQTVNSKTPGEYQKDEYERCQIEPHRSHCRSHWRKRLRNNLFFLYNELDTVEELSRPDYKFYGDIVPAILENGMFEFTREIGFVFHKSHFQIICTLLGSERAQAAVHESIMSTFDMLHVLGEDKTLQGLVIAAATNNEISLDGLYTMIRMDPIAAVMPNHIS